ncbi:canalicular multispecific organic anion transporter 1 [Aspergillus affinis]|uniref:canalicular multispecific organic anion transporter 1 n=1 Tax=Aspergillus affinis TaxID=1070780 RepID=UPI0022FE2EFB|nr:canalicular multispecific organic anion transporter 1 [Aspergillus affinis]KAI9043097.1 canalicular multispecific organic anion transporter 1 [Aspergillus affinis]
MLTLSAYLAISYPILGALLYLVQRYYLQTSRQLRLLDLEAKGPLYTHFLDTLKGIATLRAFVFISEDIQKNDRLIDSSQRAAYLLPMVQEWLSLVLNLIVMVIAAVMTTLAVHLQSSSAFAGASMYSLMSFWESLSGIVVYYTRLETSIGAIARLKAFNDTVTPEGREGPGEEDIIPDESWPDRGLVELRGVSARYKSTAVPQSESESDVESGPETNSSLALNNIHLTIQPGEKIAICGRTGSGKSSLLALLLKILDPLSSSTDCNDQEPPILIDNIPCTASTGRLSANASSLYPRTPSSSPTALPSARTSTRRIPLPPRNARKSSKQSDYGLPFKNEMVCMPQSRWGHSVPVRSSSSRWDVQYSVP